MLIRLIACACCALWLAPALGQSPATPPTEPAAASGAPRGFLWEIRKAGRRAYLLGTIHVGRPEFHPLRDGIVARLREAAVIAVEADVSEAARGAARVQELAYYGDGVAGLDARAPALRSRLDAFARRQGLSGEVFERMKPWMAANTVVIIEAARAGLSPAYATEAFLFDFARRNGKALAEIESIDEQLRLFDSAPETTQIAYLQQALDSIDSGESRDEITRLVGAWERGDAAEMERLLVRMRSATGVAERFVVERIIDGRHPRMLEAIERFAASGRLHVIAIGSLHFFGSNGLIADLRRRGYAVEAVD